MKHIAVIGSSGGGVAGFSSIDIVDFLRQSVQGINGTQVAITKVQFIACDRGFDEGMDSCKISNSKLFAISKRKDQSVVCLQEGSVPTINKLAEKLDEEISLAILQGDIDAIVSVSSDPGLACKGVNKLTIDAAILKGIPIVGTGGTSISYIATSGGLIIGSSGGSVATTSYSRALCFASSLAAYWGCTYSLVNPPVWPKFRSICGATMPIFLFSAVVKRICEVLLYLFVKSFDSSFHELSLAKEVSISSASENWAMQLVSNAASVNTVRIAVLHVLAISLRDLIDLYTHSVIPIAVSALAALETSGMGTMSVLAGSISGALLTKSSAGLVGAYISGALTGFLMPYLHIKCAFNAFPTTATTIVSVGASAVLSGTFLCIILGLANLCWSFVLCYYHSSLTTWKGIFYEHIVLLMSSGGVLDLSFGWNYFTVVSVVIGSSLGYIISWGSEQGYYHTVMLPLIALEMQNGNFSTAGTFDALLLCAPCAGVCLGVWIISIGSDLQQNQHARLGWSGFKSNFLFGDFVEACYPYTQPDSPFSSPTLLVIIRVTCALSGSLITHSWLSRLICNTGDVTSSLTHVQSSAYLPLPVILGMWGSDWSTHQYILYACFISFMLPFTFTCILLQKLRKGNCSDSSSKKIN